MATRIKSTGEFLEKIEIAGKLQKKILAGKGTEQNHTVYAIIMDEIKEYKPIFIKKHKPKK